MQIRPLDDWGEHYPIFLNPDFNECLRLAKSGWDTLRILDDGENIIIASGYGNEHNTLARFGRLHLGKRWNADPSILYHENGIAYLNASDMGGPEKTTKIWKYFSDNHVEILKDIIRESGLALGE